MTLEELCRYASHLYGRWDPPYARALAKRWELPMNRQVGRISAGEQRKAALVLAFASRAEVLLLDEPAAGLDPIARRALADEIIELIAGTDGCTVPLSTHLLEDLERLVDALPGARLQIFPLNLEEILLAFCGRNGAAGLPQAQDKTISEELFNREPWRS
jgi:ABC-type multidrug transport system ATPase subunit